MFHTDTNITESPSNKGSLSLPRSHDADGPAKYKQEISSAGTQDCLLNKLAINKHWEGWTDVEKREPFQIDCGVQIKG